MALVNKSVAREQGPWVSLTATLTCPGAGATPGGAEVYFTFPAGKA